MPTWKSEQIRIIDLGEARTSDHVLGTLGRVLQLGGPDGNIPVTTVGAGRGWGMNWDALRDSLRCLDTGGIWGTSPHL